MTKKEIVDLVQYSYGLKVEEEHLRPVSWAISIANANNNEILPKVEGNFFFVGDLTVTIVNNDVTGSGVLTFGADGSLAGFQANLKLQATSNPQYYEKIIFDHIDFVNTDLSGELALMQFNGYQVPILK